MGTGWCSGDIRTRKHHSERASGGVAIAHTEAWIPWKGIVINMKTDEKSYSCTTRLMVFDHIVNNVPTANIPTLILQSHSRTGVKAEKIPQKTTVGLMARELWALSELQAATTIIASDSVTVGCDATTQEGVHVNTIHFTTNHSMLRSCFWSASWRYGSRLRWACVGHCGSSKFIIFLFHGRTKTKENISRITNSMTDRWAENHAALRIISSAWKKSLNELNCHLHPLDSFASACRTAPRILQPHEGKVIENKFFAGMNSRSAMSKPIGRRIELISFRDVTEWHNGANQFFFCLTRVESSWLAHDD